MVGTLPGRTQGLGLITESLLKDLQLDRVTFATMNLWATLLGSLCCVGVGRLQDQIGTRIVLTAIAVIRPSPCVRPGSVPTIASAARPTTTQP